ncbi:universal stress protein [Nannocystis sp.]|uniref:universal stress protein n=1 Tax=Nannocystis sp. TaxID=1962667 RepID=UPI0024230405|nr:universal stress protein [Nannocystis sp.]MBK7827306.1 universal stress protein [Nannocystis sp.]MBK9754719.1 universal stress protein [Nannocystis sp.]
MTVQPFARILVPIDFQPATDEQIAAGHAVLVQQQYIDYASASLRSIALAAGLAKLSGARIVLLHVTPPLAYSSMYTGSLTVGLSQQVMAEVHKAAHDTSIAALQVVADRYCAGIEVELVARPGVALSVILGEAELREVDLIVLAASGRSRVARFFVGSTADRIIREASCPVLVVPAQVSTPA